MDEPEVRPPYLRIAVFLAMKAERARLAEQIYEHMDGSPVHEVSAGATPPGST